MLNVKVGDTIRFKVPYLGQTELVYRGKVLSTDGVWVQVRYSNVDNDIIVTDIENSSIEAVEKEHTAKNIVNASNEMLYVQLAIIAEYAAKIFELVKNNSSVQDWIKMKIYHVQKSLSDIKHHLMVAEKFEEGGVLLQKNLNHISDYAKEISDMIKDGITLEDWQKSKIAIASETIDDIYHHLAFDMKMAFGGARENTEFRVIDISNPSGIKKSQSLLQQGWTTYSSSPTKIVVQKIDHDAIRLSENKRKAWEKIRLTLLKHGSFNSSSAYHVQKIGVVPSIKRFLYKNGISFEQNPVNPKLFTIKQ